MSKEQKNEIPDIIFSSDKPISDERDDRFQRYGFAKRIADTIVDRKDEDCIVIGIYGAWGEGKTSIINFIETELDKHKENIISIKFNPWRYNDENALLIHFFQTLATELHKKLKNTWKELGQVLREYGEVLDIDIPFIGNIGKKVKALANLIPKESIEGIKSKIGDILKDNNKRVVIFIDDIDRLDKAEIHAIFRLVKLNADFSNVTYILSFDNEMVSAAIGERFATGNQKSGQNFLEKIIQVPLNIPTAQPEALQHFCFELIIKAINTNNIKITEEEQKRFENDFSSYILNRLDTPRLAVRYANSLSFSLPLLVGEVYIVDLMLIEAIKIFYPNHYELIKSSPELFIEYPSLTNFPPQGFNRVNPLDEVLKKLEANFTKKQKTNIDRLLSRLFPSLKENHIQNDKALNEWFKMKRIASPKYFNRYFSYAVIRGEISDIEFQDFLSKISTQSDKEISDTIKTFVAQSTPESFLYKIRSFENDFDWDTSVKIAKGISISSEIFPHPNITGMSLGFGSPRSQAANFIYQLISNNPNKEEGFEFTKLLMNDAQPFEFAFEINNWLRSGEHIDQKIFSIDQYEELAQLLRKRALNEAGEQPVFEKFNTYLILQYLLRTWAEQNKSELTEYIRNILNNSPEKVIGLMSALISTIYFGPNKPDFTKDDYQLFSHLFDIDYINQIIAQVYSDEEINAEEPTWADSGEVVQTNLNIVRQFRHWQMHKIPGPAK